MGTNSIEEISDTMEDVREQTATVDVRYKVIRYKVYAMYIAYIDYPNNTRSIHRMSIPSGEIFSNAASFGAAPSKSSIGSRLSSTTTPWMLLLVQC